MDNVREAAESLLSGRENPNYRSLTHSTSLNLVAEDVVAGYRHNGKMSTVRRFFCLFVTFDLLFTGLMWLICVMMHGETIGQIVTREIIHYNVKSSLFDIVLLALCRFSILLLFYALLYINNWSVIALSTGGSCALLITKVYVFDWPNASQPVFEVFLILTSFVLAWGEAWFLDFRVLPQETHARYIIEAVSRSNCAEHGLSRPRMPVVRAGTVAESTGNWFSPEESPESTPRPPGRSEIILTQEQIDEYKGLAEQSMQNAWRISNLLHWNLEKRNSKGDIVESANTQQFGKVYRFTGLVEAPSAYIYSEFKNNIVKLPEWNPTILKSEVIKEISDGIDLCYQVVAGGGGGVIAARDFVILRRNAALDRTGSVAGSEEPHCYISSGVSVSVPGYPPTKHVRGNNKVGCWLLKPKKVTTSSGKIENHTIFQWLMCCDLKGRIPQFVLDKAFVTAMMDYIVHVRKFAAESKAKGLY